MNKALRDNSDPFEEWFCAAIAKQGCTPAHLLQAMQTDGFPIAEAAVLAAVAMARYSSAPLREWLGTDIARDALELIRRHGGPFLQQLHAAEQPLPVLEPADALPNRMSLPDHGMVTVQAINRSPRLTLFGNFLAAHECDALIELARHRLSHSAVVNDRTGEIEVDGAARSSHDTFIKSGGGTIVDTLRKRASSLLGCDESLFEDVSVVRYTPGGEFLEHVDFLYRDGWTDVFGESGDRIATLVIYLNDVSAGGCTEFPIAGLQVRPQRGQAVYFVYQHGDGSGDTASLHASEPVMEGEKWIATLWIHSRPVNHE